jgi:hypothetical protein
VTEVRLQDASEGAEVAEDVYHGKTLLVQSGTRLTTTIISSLIRRGVESVVVRDSSEAANSSDVTSIIAQEASDDLGSSRATESLNKAMARIDQQFAPYADDPIMTGIKIAAARHWAERVKQTEMARMAQSGRTT